MFVSRILIKPPDLAFQIFWSFKIFFTTSSTFVFKELKFLSRLFPTLLARISPWTKCNLGPMVCSMTLIRRNVENQYISWPDLQSICQHEMSYYKQWFHGTTFSLPLYRQNNQVIDYSELTDFLYLCISSSPHDMRSRILC